MTPTETFIVVWIGSGLLGSCIHRVLDYVEGKRRKCSYTERAFYIGFGFATLVPALGRLGMKLMKR